jgi:aryl-alcohol dehydrogenase-like predicted oxidoreductase
MKRREFFANALAGAGALQSLQAAGARAHAGADYEKLERRRLGRTGQMLSVLGFGGTVVMNATEAQASQRVLEAIEAGINFFDVSPMYGNAEDRLGPALEPYRHQVFLAGKTLQRTRDGATADLERSLKRLRTHYLDLYQLHAIAEPADVEQVTGPRGALEALAAAQRAGKIRFIGFSTHSSEAALDLISRFLFDAIAFPLTPGVRDGSGPAARLMVEALDREMGIVALKSMARGPWPAGATKDYPKCWYQPLDRTDEVRAALRFALAHPVTSVIPPGDENLFRMVLLLADRLQPMSSAEVREHEKKVLTGRDLFPNWEGPVTRRAAVLRTPLGPLGSP